MCSPIACHYLSQALQIYNPVLWHCVHLCVCSSFVQFSVMWCMQYLYCRALINASASPNFPPFSFCYLIISCLSQLSIFACTKYLTSALKIGKGDVEKNIFLFLIFFSQNHLLLRFEMIVIFFRGYFWKIKWYEGCASVVFCLQGELSLFYPKGNDYFFQKAPLFFVNKVINLSISVYFWPKFGSCIFPDLICKWGFRTSLWILDVTKIVVKCCFETDQFLMKYIFERQLLCLQTI